MLVGDKYIRLKSSIKELKTVVVIPAYNEADHIGDVVDNCKKYVDDVIVVDNNSKDTTSDIALQIGANVEHCYAKGAGIATLTGMETAINSSHHADIIVTLDGDGQHNSDDIPQLIEPIINGKADIVIGSRFLGLYKSNVPVYRYIGIAIINFLYNMCSRNKLTDTQCCFRAYKNSVLKECKITEYGFAFSIETLVKARVKKYRIVEIPVKVKYHSNLNENSSTNPIEHGIKVAWSVIKWRLKVEVFKIKV